MPSSFALFPLSYYKTDYRSRKQKHEGKFGAASEKFLSAPRIPFSESKINVSVPRSKQEYYRPAQDKEQGDRVLTHSITRGSRCCAALASCGTILQPGTMQGVRLKNSRRWLQKAEIDINSSYAHNKTYTNGCRGIFLEGDGNIVNEGDKKIDIINMFFCSPLQIL